jgi:hypothetical protein
VLPVALLAALGDLAPHDDRLDHERDQRREDQTGDAEHRGEVPVEQPRDHAGDRRAEEPDPTGLRPVDRSLANQELRHPPRGERHPEHPEDHDQRDHRAAG